MAHRGEAIGLIGVNGSGKSTLLLAIAGLLPPSPGRVYTEGQPSLLGVNAALMNDLTGERNVVLGGLAAGMSRAEVRAGTTDIVDFSGVNDNGDFISLPMRTYSSGMGAAAFRHRGGQAARRAARRRGAGHRRRQFRRRSEERIRQLRADAGTVFLVSHSLGVVRETCERTIWIDRGGPRGRTATRRGRGRLRGAPRPGGRSRRGASTDQAVTLATAVPRGTWSMPFTRLAHQITTSPITRTSREGRCGLRNTPTVSPQ